MLTPKQHRTLQCKVTSTPVQKQNLHLQAAQLILGDTSLLPLKEWEGLNGKLGVYHSQAHGHYSLFILIPSEEKHSTQSYPPTDLDQALHAAEFIAAFAGAQEILP
ncbi:hypothetical protein [Ktedonobacter racemifer]|uniref:hypothetical protein n=1 Tax=Ktedonobacter racemifer TaxID=363277 RepID=UPI00058AC815|nr:hypothetical protein [Ktedonobacter racemifer]